MLPVACKPVVALVKMIGCVVVFPEVVTLSSVFSAPPETSIPCKTRVPPTDTFDTVVKPVVVFENCTVSEYMGAPGLNSTAPTRIVSACTFPATRRCAFFTSRNELSFVT